MAESTLAAAPSTAEPGLDALRQQALGLALRRATGDGTHATAVPGLKLIRASAPPAGDEPIHAAPALQAADDAVAAAVPEVPAAAACAAADAGRRAGRQHHVGYESPSQFSREYRRLFGTPPRADISQLKAPAAAT